jgi:hypothetical protein
MRRSTAPLFLALLALTGSGSAWAAGQNKQRKQEREEICKIAELKNKDKEIQKKR